MIRRVTDFDAGLLMGTCLGVTIGSLPLSFLGWLYAMRALDLLNG